MLGYAGAITRDIGAPISYTVSGNPTNTTTTTPTGGSTSTASPIAYVLIGAGISALLIAGVLALRERLTASGKTSKSTPEVNPKAAINALMEQIAELDVQQKAGKISARDYETKRAELKAQLSQLMNSQR